MRRNATYLLVSALIPLTIAGCNASGKSGAAAEPAVSMVDSYTPPVEEAAYEADPYAIYGSPAPVESGFEPLPSTSSIAPRYHTVAKKDTLYGLARTYYGDQRRWRDIYDANCSTISDPNKIRVGQRLLIP